MFTYTTSNNAYKMHLVLINNQIINTENGKKIAFTDKFKNFFQKVANGKRKLPKQFEQHLFGCYGNYWNGGCSIPYKNQYFSI